jgi:hypothetical protein
MFRGRFYRSDPIVRLNYVLRSIVRLFGADMAVIDVD